MSASSFQNGFLASQRQLVLTGRFPSRDRHRRPAPRLVSATSAQAGRDDYFQGTTLGVREYMVTRLLTGTGTRYH
jgi:hypothetical protein